MALGNVIMTDSDGNIGNRATFVSDEICGLLFDISGQTDFWTKGAGLALSSVLKDKVIELNTLEDAVKLGITGHTGDDVDTAELLSGIPYYHIKTFFNLNSDSGRLFVAFADCSADWNALINMSKASHGLISQFGVWTEQKLWKQTAPDAAVYAVNIVAQLESVAVTLARDYNSPASIIVSPNTSRVGGADDESKVVFSKMPSVIKDARYVSVALSQDNSVKVRNMQASLTSTTPVGIIGGILGCLAKASVHECIGWVDQFEISGYYADIEFGFGDSTISATTHQLTSSTAYDSLAKSQLDTLQEQGYIFLCKYSGLEGNVYFSGDTTCDDGDYCTIARNRTIDKSRRAVRIALLPYVNSPIYVDPATGQLSTADITIFTNIITEILTAMKDAKEISGIGKIVIPARQNILQNDTLILSYSIVPVWTAREIQVTEGLAISQA